MAHYIIQTLVFQLLFLGVYDLFLKKETFFNWNRWYLIGTAALSLVLPFVQIAAIGRQISPELRVQLPTVFIGGEGFVPTVPNPEEFVFPWMALWQIGAVLAGHWFASKLFKIFRLSRSGQRTRLQDFMLVILPDTKTAFSFWRTVFLGADLAPKQREIILQHEQVHVKQRHTFDQLFFELLRILFWFNPLVYMYQNRMSSLQEYIADAKVAAIQGKGPYYQELLAQVFQSQNISFVNTFFNHSLIKKRITMLQRSRSSRLKLLKYTVLLPLIALMVFYTSCSQESEASKTEVAKTTADTEVMTKIIELSEALKAKGELSPEERNALNFFANPTTEGDQIYWSLQQHLIDPSTVTDSKELHFDQSQAIAFALLDEVPVYPGCEGLDLEAAKNCFQSKLSQFIAAEFDTESLKDQGFSGKQRIQARFVINTQGQVADIEVRAPSEALKEVTLKVLQAIPQLRPGKKGGKTVAVNYSLPIIFDIGE